MQKYLTFDQIVRMGQLVNIEGTDTLSVIDRLNHLMTDLGVEFGESDFGVMEPSPGFPEKWENYRWIDVAYVSGSNEGYYIHITFVPQKWDRHPSYLVATAKTWTRASAMEITAVASQLLSV